MNGDVCSTLAGWGAGHVPAASAVCSAVFEPRGLRNSSRRLGVQQQNVASSQFWRPEVHDQGPVRLLSGQASRPAGGRPRSRLCVTSSFLGESHRPLVSLLVRTPVLWDLGPTLMASFSFNYFLKAPSPNTARLGVGAST